MSLEGKVAIVTGSTRGIGREVALHLAREGAKVVITGKTQERQANLTGTIYTVCEEVRLLGAPSLAIPCDVRSEAAISAMVAQVVAEWGGIDILVNNASAITTMKTLETPLKRMDLMYNVNVRGTFACAMACVPYLKESDNPHILNMSPPIPVAPHWYKDYLPYAITKVGMSYCTLGLSQELRQWCIAVNSLWPRTTIATAAVKNLFPPAIYPASRRPEIVAKAAIGILKEDSETVTGQFFIDEAYLRAHGETNFEHYAVDPNHTLQTDFFLDDDASDDNAL